MRKIVYVEVRTQGSIGIFSWKSVPIETDSNNPEDWRNAAIDEAHQSGYETRRVTLSLDETL